MKKLSPVEKQLAIKTNVVCRIKKEYLAYEKEIQQQKNQLEVLIAANESPSKLKHQGLLIGESEAVYYQAKAKLISEKENLQKMMDDNEENSLLATETWGNAKKTLAEVNQFIDEHVLKSGN